MRIQLETLAVRAALPRLREADVERMRALHEELRSRVEGPDAQQAFSGLNREFHLTLYRAAGSPALIRLITDLSAQAERMRLHFDVRRGRAGDDHARILAALAARDVEEAVAATRDHILGALVMMMPAGFEVTPGSTLDLALRASGWSPALAG
jgi:DNA-binding GntR family transcriptional regulator